MASTYAQRKRAVVAALRKARQLYRQADTAGERVERELDRLVLRKTLISPEQLQKLTRLYSDYANRTSNIQGGLTIALTVAQQ